MRSMKRSLAKLRVKIMVWRMSWAQSLQTLKGRRVKRETRVQSWMTMTSHLMQKPSFAYIEVAQKSQD